MSLRVDPVTPIEREKVRREFASGNVDFLITLHQGNPATLAFDRLLSAVSDGAYHREACRRKFRKLKQSLAGPESSQIVKLMAAGVAFAWFDVYFADARYYMRMNLDDNALVESYDRRRHRAARRLNRAIKQLADVQQSTLANVYQRIPRFEFMTGVGAN